MDQKTNELQNQNEDWQECENDDVDETENESSELLDDDDDDFEIISSIKPEDEQQTATPKKRRGPKPKLIGKHSLAYDSIFKGKKSIARDEDDYESEHILTNVKGGFEIAEEFSEYGESQDEIGYYRSIRLKNEIRDLLVKHTEIDFNAPRRRPSKADYNAYYAMLLKDLGDYGYTYTEIFIELSAYFSDNIWNMFLWLDKSYSNVIIQELKSKYKLSDIDKMDII